ncbi:hypothetical protein FDA09_11670 [Clostridium botulinum]|uniref:hypothetical protein n=1 Tax=Clostridium botulinum TaxID=1491 RepID=UPI00077381CF|nr:hypothetical protein [Clostridium botulinum]NFF80409.1 hypothetical protein [Clostridium botulinum]NFH80808.1 hypothetical protein [Clostridium botulinum]NFH83185.1 hypothetical protein [Clostridium botulinum]NFI12050.1 hypothetical protein [Clostridium botulinum]NFI15801.1 hypothetical protein [Clostridium botulinum]
MNIETNGKILLKEYADTLKISIEDATKIIMKNKSAIIFLQQDNALGLTSKNKNLGILLRTTLLRQKDDFSELNSKDIDFIKKYYKLEIRKINISNELPNYLNEITKSNFKRKRKLRSDILKKTSNIYFNRIVACSCKSSASYTENESMKNSKTTKYAKIKK